MNNRPLKIAILDCTKTIYNEQSSGAMPLGGIERCVISLSRALADKGHEVQVFAHEEAASDYNNIRWTPRSKVTDFKADIVVACNDPKLFNQYEANANHKIFKPYLWLHNPVGFWKTVRKGRISALLKWRPTNIFLGTYHLASYPKLLPNQKNMIIEHGVESSVLNFPSLTETPPPHAAFISQTYRGLENLIQIWKHFIFPANPLAKLFIYSYYHRPESELAPYGITVEGRLSRPDLLNHLSTKRVILIPGHKDETFCLSAIESHCLGIPVVSFGIGALEERIVSGKDGFVANTNEDFAEKTLMLLQNDALWREMSNQAITRKATASWSDKATLWENLFREAKNDQR